MRVIVTGALGYIGSRITRSLLDRGHEVFIIDDGTYDQPLVREYVHGATVVIDDVAALSAGTYALFDRRIDWCFHLAALSNDGSADISEHQTRRVNVGGTELIAGLCADRFIPMVFASTASVYGHVEWELSREASFLNPQSEYARSKVIAEAVIHKLALERTLRCVILRQATVFGWSPRMRYDLVVNALLKSALSEGKVVANGGGECWRPLVYVGDLANVWCNIAERATPTWWSQQQGCPTFNLVHKNYRISELVWWMTLLLRERGIECEMIRDTMEASDQRDYAMDGSRARHAGYACDTGITHAIDEMLRHIGAGRQADFDNPIYYNVRWIKERPT